MQLQVSERVLALSSQSAAYAKMWADAEERVVEFAKQLAAEVSAQHKYARSSSLLCQRGVRSLR